MNEMMNWHVVYTRPLCERKIAQYLAQKGIETYCPPQRLPRKGEPPLKGFQTLLFPRWVFVRCLTAQLPSLRSINGVINVVYWQHNPAVVTNEDITTLQFVLSRFEEVHPQQTGMKPLDVIQLIPGTEASFVLSSLGFTLCARGEIRSSPTYLPALSSGEAVGTALFPWYTGSFHALLKKFPSLPGRKVTELPAP